MFDIPCGVVSFTNEWPDSFELTSLWRLGWESDWSSLWSPSKRKELFVFINLYYILRLDSEDWLDIVIVDGNCPISGDFDCSVVRG